MHFYTKQHNAYGGIDLHARSLSVSCTTPATSWYTATCKPVRRHCCGPLRPPVRIASWPSHGSFPGTGSPICGPAQGCLVPSAMRSPCRPCMAVRPQTTRWTRTRAPCSGVGACSPTLRSLQRRGGRPVPCSGVGCLSPANGRSGWRTSSIRTARIIGPRLGQSWPPKRTAPGAPSGSPILRC
jgi:hypothetical protein